jgi:hypothetical protein
MGCHLNSRLEGVVKRDYIWTSPQSTAEENLAVHWSFGAEKERKKIAATNSLEITVRSDDEVI